MIESQLLPLDKKFFPFQIRWWMRPICWFKAHQMTGMRMFNGTEEMDLAQCSRCGLFLYKDKQDKVFEIKLGGKHGLRNVTGSTGTKV